MSLIPTAIPRDKRTCGNCWWYEEKPQGEAGGLPDGECFQAPPVVTLAGDDADAWTTRPDVYPIDRACSKWAPR